jgi:hypothetical protein
MRKSVLFSTVLLLAAFLAMPIAQDTAQTVTIKRKAVSPRELGTYPAGTFPVSTGLRGVPINMKVYLMADTVGVVTSFAWEFESRPAGSAAAFDATDKDSVTFKPDVVGQYIVKVTANGSLVHKDTLYAGKFVGTNKEQDCGFCHSASSEPKLKFAEWKNTKHATIFTDGITGNEEVEGDHGEYGKNCIKCHTTGWDQTADNGNFGFEAKKTGFDTLWYKVGTDIGGGNYLITTGDSTWYDSLYNNSKFASAKHVATIGCESCHGPASEHVVGGVFAADPKVLKASLSAGSCLTCHDAPNKHRLGSYWLESAHSTMHKGHASSTSCYPCHSGTAFVKYVKGEKSTYSLAEDGTNPIACATCHDPHSDANAYQLRVASVDSLINGFDISNQGGTGATCMTCHQARYNVAKKVTNKAPYYGFSDRYGPHHSPQTDMFFGSNGYEFGKSNLSGLTTHGTLENSCATCHMATRVNGSSVHSNHAMSMRDEEGNPTEWGLNACRSCHGEGLQDYGDVQAFADYDNDGTVEGAQHEVEGLLDLLKAQLPQDNTGAVISMMKDSLKVKGNQKAVQGIWNYHFVEDDLSKGIHNMKYTVALLQSSLTNLIGIQFDNVPTPDAYQLSQNYPNPFNPNTTINFMIPKAGNVKVTIYDALGKEIEVLVNKDYAAGKHSISWNAARYSSGVYFYRMETSGFNTVKKMLLLK